MAIAGSVWLSCFSFAKCASIYDFLTRLIFLSCFCSQKIHRKRRYRAHGFCGFMSVAGEQNRVVTTPVQSCDRLFGLDTKLVGKRDRSQNAPIASHEHYRRARLGDERTVLLFPRKRNAAFFKQRARADENLAAAVNAT